MKRILIVDDHAIVRRGIQNEIEEHLGNMHFGEASNVKEARTVLKADTRWDLVLLDIGLEKQSGLDLLEELDFLTSSISFLIVSHFPAQELGVRAMQLGARGYFCKTDPPEKLILAIKQVLDGKKYITENLAMALAAEVCRKTGLPHELLSRRELELLKLLAHGKSQKEAAEHMGLNIKTVSTYHVRLMQKMKLNTDVDLTRYALRHNLVLLT